MSIDKDAIARQYAATIGKQIAEFCVTKGEDSYFRIDYAVRPRYLGHPHVIKISDNGDITQIRELDEIYWALTNRATVKSQ